MKTYLLILCMLAPVIVQGQLARNDSGGVAILGMPGLVKGGIPVASIDTATSYRLVLDSTFIQSSSWGVEFTADTSKKYLLVLHGAYALIDELLLPGTIIFDNNRDWYGFWCRMVVIDDIVSPSSQIEVSLTEAGDCAIELYELTNAGTHSGFQYDEAQSTSASITVTSQTGAFVFAACTFYANTGETVLTPGSGITTLALGYVGEYTGFFLGVKAGASSVTNFVTFSDTIDHTLCGYSQP